MIIKLKVIVYFNLMKRYLILEILILGILLCGCEQKRTYQYTEGGIYGTFYHISYAAAEDLQAEIREQMELVNESLSMFNPQSVISRINRNETDQTDTLFRRMFVMAKVVNEATDGVYDITIAPLVNAWGFGFEKEVFPDSARIDSLLLMIGMDKLQIQGEKLQKQVVGMKLDASSIAKGLGVDLVADYFNHKGIKDYMVEIGGEVRVKGQSDKGRPWRIGIDRPEDDVTAQARQFQMVIELTNGALATSGNYRNYYIHEGKKYAHTINPKTGFPVQTEVVGASVFSPTCMEADAYATAFMVAGLEKAKQVIENSTELEGCLIYEEEGKLKTWVSDGLKKMIVSEFKNK